VAERGTGLVVGMRLDLGLLREYEEHADQFPFAISLAMNKTAKGPAVDHLREGLVTDARFTVRGKWTPGGIRFWKAASKTDLTVKLGAINDYLRAQSVGTSDPTRPDGEGGGPLGAVPIGQTRQPATTKLARRNDWPRQLIARGLAFRPGIDHRRKTSVAETTSAKTGRTRKVKVKEAPDPLKPGDVLFSTHKHPSGWGRPLWLIHPDKDVDLRPVYPVQQLTREAYAGHFSDALRKAIRHAIRTRRPKPPQS
jgi:hypothetical protein